jgi:translation initiation factor eIF-2B subunit delta
VPAAKKKEAVVVDAPAKKDTTRTEGIDKTSLFAHLELAKGATRSATKEVHPAILQLGLLYAEYKICGGNARCRALLAAFKRASTPSPPLMLGR